MLYTIVCALVLFGFARAQQVSVDNCPLTLPRDGYLKVHNGRCYYFHLEEKEDYGAAEDICKYEGGTLVMVKTKETNQFVHEQLAYQFADKQDHKRVWIGLDDLQQEGHFKWIDGSDLTYSNFATLQGPKAPLVHILKEVEDCVAIDQKSGQWYDYLCESTYYLFDEKRPYVCEFAPLPPPTTTTTNTTAAPVTSDIDNNNGTDLID